MHRIVSFLKKYGFCNGIIGVLRFLCSTTIMRIAARILDFMPENYFRCHANNKKINLYEGNIEADAKRILSGEKKLLFYNPIDPNIAEDIKYKWEDERLHDIYILAQADNAEARKKYEMILDDYNVVTIHPDDIAMEVSIRAINIIESAKFYKGNINEKNVVTKFLKSALIYILRNPERGVIYSGNHYFFNLLGILWILENIEGNWIINGLHRFSKKRLIVLLKQIILKDGALYENSTHYHKYVTESYLLYLASTGKKTNKVMLSFAEKMWSFCEFMATEGKIIGIGDNDSGRILPLPNYYQYSSVDITVIRKLAKQLNLKKIIGNGDEFGIFVLQNRTWKCYLRCDLVRDAKKNRTIGNHAHNDQLSVYLWYCNIPVFIDRGTYMYILKEDIRKNNMLTKHHNTVSIGRYEQNKLPEGFTYFERTAKGTIIEKTTTSMTAEITGYYEHIHKRKISVIESGIEIIDTIENAGNQSQSSEIHFCIAPIWKVQQISANICMLKCDNNSIIMKSQNPISIREGEVFPEYGEIVKVKCVDIELASVGVNHVQICEQLEETL